MDDPAFVNVNDNILIVIKKLLQLKKGCVLVNQNNGNTVGIISDRDIHRLIIKEGGMFSPDLLAKNCMVKPVIMIIRTATLQNAEELMHEHKINRLPVVEKEGSKKVIGIVNYETVHSNIITNFAKKWVKRYPSFNR
ncbi:MAG: CBS domain-containing protein [Candidatus Heimdallarchaeota archaeon]|nr:CBS domain-containing protein [Candidatus Heimdallarchaeota archaeon]MBY8995820.1 CBS domain-containing protein [Candidatus Heimdallarchaeota archaeon]